MSGARPASGASTPDARARGLYSHPWAEALLVATLLGGVILTRALAANTFVTWDEPAWTYRSVHFLLALLEGDLRGTAITGHPGVTTTWLGALGLAWNLRVAPTISWAQVSAIGALPTLEVHDADTMRRLAVLLPAAKSALPLAHAGIALALYALLRRLAGRGAALVALAVLLLDPYYLALSRVLHIDALAAGLMLVAALGALAHVRGNRPRRYLIVSGVATGLAVLTKTYGAFVAPFALATIIGGAFARPRAEGRWTGLAHDIALWAATAAGALILAWPALWVAPRETLAGVLGLSLEYATAPGDATASFFRGVLAGDPGATFYPVAALYRTTPLVLLGAVLAVGLSLWRAASRRGRGAEVSSGLTWGLLAYAALHLALITLSKKKFDRYMLPALLALDVVAALGWYQVLGLVANALGAREGRRAWSASLPAVAGALLAVTQAGLILAPLSLSHAIAAYNPWAGGLGGAIRTLPVGWGEGVEQAARYLASKPDAAELHVATWAVAGVAPLFPGQVAKPTPAALADADYVVIYIGDVQSETPLAAAFSGQQEPEYVAYVAGQPYVWVYRNAFGEALGAEIDDAASPGDTIVLNASSAFERQYRGGLPALVPRGDEAEMARQIAALARDAEGVFYVAYDGQPAHPLVRRLLAQNGLLLWERPFAYGTLAYYRLVDAATAMRPVAATVRSEATFGDRLVVAGYGLSAGAIEYRQELGVALRWRVAAPAEHDYHASLRLVDAAGRTWGQYDAPLEDAAGERTGAWVVGTEHEAYLPLTVEPGTPPGDYRVALGLYRLDDLQRLTVAGVGPSPEGAPPVTQIDLGAVRVLAATVPLEPEELGIPHRSGVVLGDAVEVLGYALSRETVPSGEELVATLYLRCTDSPRADDDLLLRVVRDGNVVGRTRARPVGDAYPTDAWREGDVFRYAHSLRIDPGAPGGEYALLADLVTRGEEDPPVSGGAPLATLVVEHVERLFEPPTIGHPAAARFGAAIVLLGYDLDREAAAPGEALRVTLYWRATGAISRSYTAFVHLLDASGAVRGQRDSAPAAGQRPTDGWLEGEVIVDAYELAVSSDAPAGAHHIEIGLYDPATGERLPVTDAAGNPIPERRLLLESEIIVAP